MKLQYIVWGAGVSNLKAIRKAKNDIKLIELLSVSEKEIVEKLFARNGSSWIVSILIDSYELKADEAILGYKFKE